jgi:hypothetical protein
LEQNPQFQGLFSVTSRRIGNRIIRIYGAGDGNRTHVRSLGSFYTAIVRRPLDAVILTHPRGWGTDPAIQTLFVVCSGGSTYAVWISRKKSRLGADPAREYPAEMTRANGLPSAGVPVVACGFAACTFLTPSGIPVPPTKARADSNFPERDR